MDKILVSMLGISATVTAVILLLYLLKKPLRKRFTAGCRYLLWLLVIVRLCVPVSVFGGEPLINLTFPQSLGESSVTPETSVEDNKENIPNEGQIHTNVQPSFTDKEVGTPSATVPVNPPVNDVAGDIGSETPIGGGIVNGGKDTSPVSTDNLDGMNNIVQPDVGESQVNKQPVGVTGQIADGNTINTEEKNSLSFGEKLTYTVFGIWLTGAAAFLFVELIRYLRFTETLEYKVTPADGELLELYREICRKNRIKKSPVLYTSNSFPGPMLTGYFKPGIILPDMEFENNALEGIISHELTHYKRGDLWVKFLGVLARSIHWFNPAVSLAVKMMNEEMELSCDEKTLKNVSEENRLEYGTVMVDILKKSKGMANAFSTGFNPNKNTAKERITNILDGKKKNRGVFLVALCLLLCALAGSVFGCVDTSDNKDNKVTPPSVEDGGKKPQADEEGEYTAIDYGYSYCRVENIKNEDNKIFGYVNNAESLSGGDYPVFRFNTFTEFKSFMEVFGDRSDYEDKNQFSDISFEKNVTSPVNEYDIGYFGEKSLIVICVKETSDKRYAVSSVAKAEDGMKIELYPVSGDIGLDPYGDEKAVRYSCQFYLVEVSRADADGCKNFTVTKHSGDEKLYSSSAAESLSWKYPEEKTKLERDNDGIINRVEFFTTTPSWKLCYEIDGAVLTLTNGNKTYTFSNDNGATYRVMFLPVNAQSAAAIISPDEKYAAVIFDGVRLVHGENYKKTVYLIELESGRLIETTVSYPVTETETENFIFYTNGINSDFVKSYSAYVGYTDALFTTDIKVDFADNDTVIFHRQLLSKDGNFRLYDRCIYDIGVSKGLAFEKAGDYYGVLNGTENPNAVKALKEIRYIPENSLNIGREDLRWTEGINISDYCLALSVPEEWIDLGGTYSPAVYYSPETGVAFWKVFSIEKDYVFEDDFINYVSPKLIDTPEASHTPVWREDLNGFVIKRGTTKMGYDYISYDNSKFYLRVTDTLVWSLEFYTPLDTKTVMDIVDSALVTSSKVVYPILESIAADEGLKNTAIAFLSKDTAKLEALTRNKSGVFDAYAGLKLDLLNAEAKTEGNTQKLLLTVDVTDGGGTAINPGRQQIEIYGGVSGYSLVFCGQGHNDMSDCTELQKNFLMSWLSVISFDYKLKMASDVSPGDMKAYSADIYEFLYYYIRSAAAKEGGEAAYTNREIADMCKKYASEVFGLTDHSGYDTVFKEDPRQDDMFFARGHGGAIYMLTVEQVDKEGNSFTVRYYADNCGTVKSHLVKYTLVPGELLPSSINFEILEASQYPPYKTHG